MTDQQAREQKQADDKAWADSHSRTGMMDSNGYTDIAGEFISLRDAPDGLAVGVNGVAGSGNVTLYNHKTNRHHVIERHSEPAHSREFVDNHNQQIRSNLVVDEPRPQASAEEEYQYAQRAIERDAEAKERGY